MIIAWLCASNFTEVDGKRVIDDAVHIHQYEYEPDENGAYDLMTLESEEWLDSLGMVVWAFYPADKYDKDSAIEHFKEFRKNFAR